MRRLYHKRSRFKYRKDKQQEKVERRGNDVGPYYNYKKSGRLIVDCQKIKSKSSTSKKPYKKKALRETWDSENESEEDVDMVNMCFMANDNNTTKVFLKTTLDDSDLSIDKLGEAFEQF